MRRGCREKLFQTTTVFLEEKKSFDKIMQPTLWQAMKILDVGGSLNITIINLD